MNANLILSSICVAAVTLTACENYPSGYYSHGSYPYTYYSSPGYGYDYYSGPTYGYGYDNGYYPYPYGSGPTYGYGYYGNQGYGYYGTQRYRYGSQGYRYGWRATPPSDASNSQTSGSPVPAPPGQSDVRWAKAAPSGASKQKTELPHGTPVPGKPGLVTSPFSLDSGYIDVRSFPPGTEVKDPYTGEIFLTP